MVYLSKGMKKKNTKLYKAFKKLLDDNSMQLYTVSIKSPILKHYETLLRLEELNKNPDFDELRIREDELYFDPKEEEEKNKKLPENKRVTKSEPKSNSVRGIDPKTNENISINFKKWFLEEVKVLISSKPQTEISCFTKRKSIHNTEEKLVEEGHQNCGKTGIDSSNITFVHTNLT